MKSSQDAQSVAATSLKETENTITPFSYNAASKSKAGQSRISLKSLERIVA
jgi:hypothetical protein